MHLHYDTWKRRLDSEIEKLAPEINTLNDNLADNPELSGEEYKSSKAIAEMFARHGLQVEMPFAGLTTAFKTGLAGIGDKKVALLVEYDALPGIGHACGHNVSGSISVLAGLAFSKVLEAIGGNLDIIGTPNEEKDGGKIVMAHQGVFTGYDLAIMIHLNSKNRVNARFMALDSLEFIFTGRPSHAAAAPWEGRNALNGVQLMFHAIDMLRQHVQPDTRMHGIIIRGGEACNIVPEDAAAHLYIRANERGYLDRVKNMVIDCALGSAKATQTEVKISNFCPSLSDLKPNKAGEMLIGECFRELGLENESDGIAFGSSDVGNMSYQCPTLHPTLALAGPGVHLHTREFAELVKGEYAYKAIQTGAKILIRACLRVFHEPGIAEKIRDDFLKTDQ